MNAFTRIVAALVIAVGAVPISTHAQSNAQTPPSSPPPATPDGDRLTPSELEELLGSIALYPDPLLANVLAASVYPDEVAEAAKFIGSGGKSAEIDGKSWEDSVKAVAKIPDAIKMMGEYPDWTIALGQAYLAQAKDVMDVVQTLRKKAKSTGALVTSPQQQVVVEKEVVYIKSADPEVIYVPSYSPSVVYVDHHDDDDWVAGAVGFGVGVAAGLIIANNVDCHWHSGCVGWGWGGGGYHSDIDIDRGDININGDVNIGNTNIKGGDRTNIKGGDRTNTNVKGGDRVSSKNRVGNEGNAWSPNKSKSLASAKPNEASRVKQGGANKPKMPSGGSRPSAGNRAGGGAGGGAAGAGGARPAARPAGGNAGARPSQPAAKPGGGAARPSQPTAKPKVPTSRPPAAGASRQPSNRGGGASPSKPSAFEGGKGTKAASQRGNASRGSGSAGRSAPAKGGGGGRSGGGGGGRSGGGGGRGGGGRR